jgi:hypothetical protein
MRSVPASEFCRNFGRIQFEAQRDTIEVTSHGRATGYFLSPAEYAKYQSLRVMSRRHLQVGELPPDVVAAIEQSEMDSRHDYLNRLLED